MKVCKFGGSSLADAKQLTKVIDIVLADPARRIVVVSAPGKRNKGDTKVTDLLIALAEAALAKKDVSAPFKAVLSRYASIAKDLGLGGEIVKEIEGDTVADVLSYVEYSPKDLLDNLRSAAERAIEEKRISPAERRIIMKAYEDGVRGYTYFEYE